MIKASAVWDSSPIPVFIAHDLSCPSTVFDPQTSLARAMGTPRASPGPRWRSRSARRTRVRPRPRRSGRVVAREARVAVEVFREQRGSGDVQAGEERRERNGEAEEGRNRMHGSLRFPFPEESWRIGQQAACQAARAGKSASFCESRTCNGLRTEREFRADGTRLPFPPAMSSARAGAPMTPSGVHGIGAGRSTRPRRNRRSDGDPSGSVTPGRVSRDDRRDTHLHREKRTSAPR